MSPNNYIHTSLQLNSSSKSVQKSDGEIPIESIILDTGVTLQFEIHNNISSLKK